MISRLGCFTIAFLSITVPVVAQVNGSGNANYLPIWTGPTSLGNSTIFETQGMVGIGGPSPLATLDVIGLNGNGGNAPTVLRATGGTGSTGNGGAGGPIQLSSGPGGRGCICNAPGGRGGSVNINGGSGGQGWVNGGLGGQIQILAGRGGQKSPAFAPGTGGFGGSIQLAAGTGATTSSGQSHGGNGGSVILQPGAGGTGTGSSGAPGAIILAPRGGKIGIGTARPTSTLDVVAGGTTLADSWTTRSSRRFKMNIHPLEEALDKIEHLQGVTYSRKSDGKHEIGVVAEDVYRVIPEVVSRDPETNEVEGVDYSRLAALLIEAVKSQQIEIQQLRRRIEQFASERVPVSLEPASRKQ